ncbi:MAG: hypothetical protein ACYTEQ_05785 [Planctomycetota bacterium]|jgi:hypothetical protein
MITRRTFLKTSLLSSVPTTIPTTAVKHIGARADRQKTRIEERIYAEEWNRLQQHRAGVNGGRGILELILAEGDWHFDPNMSERDAFVAATVAQWLGTNCGLHFLARCEQRIREERGRDRGIKWS